MSRRKKPEPRTWTVEEVARQERVLEMSVSNAARELDRVKAWHRAELSALRKFRKAKITNSAQIVPASSASRPHLSTPEKS